MAANCLENRDTLLSRVTEFDSLAFLHFYSPSSGKAVLGSQLLNAEVVEAEVCKTSLSQFESDLVVQIYCLVE